MKSYYIHDIDGEQVVTDMSTYDLWPFFRTVATRILEEEQLAGIGYIRKIVYNGVEYRHDGWRPNREYNFVNVNDPNDTYTVWLD